jgi:hypothetical protein
MDAADGETALTLAKEGLASRMTTPFNHEAEEESWQEIVHLLQQAGAKE